MEDENEVLDWGNEDDEQQQHPETRYKTSAEFDSQNGVDDAEDAVSLGEDEDYFDNQQQEYNADAESKDILHSTIASKDDIQQELQFESSEGRQRQNSSTPQNPSSVTGSPRLNQFSDQPHPSPQRSHSFTTRLTHALPPKPVVANVPYLHPSHPSIVEATAMSTRRSESLKNNSNPTSSTTISATGIKSNGADAPLPPDWETRNPRSGGHKVYYYNNQTKQSTWDRPVNSANAAPSLSGRSARRRRDRSHSAGDRPSSPSKSDQPTQEHSRSNRALSNLRGDSDIPDLQAPSHQSGELSFEDRHYRPQAVADNVTVVDSRQGTHDDEPAFTPPASPHRPRSHARGRDREHRKSFSPVRSGPPAPSRGRDSRPSRGSRGGHHGHGITDSDSSVQRDRDHSQAAFASSRNAWDQAPSNMPVDLNNSNSHQESHRQHRHRQQSHGSSPDPPFESSAFEDRPPLSRNGSTRGRNRARETRPPEGREQQNRSQNLPTTSRTRSTPPHLHDREPDSLHRAADQLPPTVSTPVPTPEVIPAHQQRRRDRPSRFDRPATMVLPLGGTNAPAQIITPVEHAILRPREDDVYIPDDIIQASRERVRHIVRDELTPSASQLIVPAGNANGPSYHDKRSRPDERDPDWDQAPKSAEYGKPSPTTEYQASRRRRVPLSPQDKRFHEAVGRPQQVLVDVDSTASYQHYRPPPSPSQLPMAPPQGPRDHHQQRSAIASTNSLPAGPRYPLQSQPRGDTDTQRMMPPSSTTDRDSSGKQDDRLSFGSTYAQSLPHSEVMMDLDINDRHSTSSRLPPSPSRNSDSQPGLRAGAGMYADRESDVPPRGPRAMATKPTSYMPDGVSPIPSASPTTPYAYGPNAGSRGRDHSPPPQQPSYVKERGTGYDNSHHESSSGWRDERHNPGYFMQDRGQGHGRREPRGRLPEFSRVNLPKLSGTNSVPIGSRKGGIRGGSPPGGQLPGNRFSSHSNPPPGISNANMEPLRNPRVRGAPPPEKESYERPPYHVNSQVDTYIPRRSESAGSHQRRRDGSPTAFEHRQHQRHVSPVLDSPITSHAPREAQYTSNEKSSRSDRPTHKDTAAPRIWTPRQPSPQRDTIVRRHSLSGGSDYRDTTPPPISREPSQTSTWESSSRRVPTGRYSEDQLQQRVENSRDVNMNADARQRQQTKEHVGLGSDRFDPEPDFHHAGSLEGRLGDRYNSQEPFEAIRQPHALPPNPTLHPDHHSPPESRRKPFPDRRSLSIQERFQSSWVDAASNLSSDAHEVLTFEDTGPHRDNRTPRSQKPSRQHRPPSATIVPQDDSSMHLHLEEFPQYNQHHPVIPKRGGSLLDRLSLDKNDDTPGMSTPWSSSLRDRVQVPSKRDRDEMIGGRYQPDNSFEGEDGGFGDPASKKPRRRNLKQFRRGAKRGSMT